MACQWKIGYSRSFGDLELKKKVVNVMPSINQLFVQDKFQKKTMHIALLILSKHCRMSIYYTCNRRCMDAYNEEAVAVVNASFDFLGHNLKIWTDTCLHKTHPAP